MAKDSDDCEFWLPPQFLTDDDDLFTEFKTHRHDGKNGLSFGRDYQPDFSFGFPGFGPNSDLSSPVDGSTETESDEDDYITELTRKLTNSTLQDSRLASESKKVLCILLFLLVCFHLVFVNTQMTFFFSFFITGFEFVWFATINAL